MNYLPTIICSIALGLSIITWQRPSYTEGFEDCAAQHAELQEELQEELEATFNTPLGHYRVCTQEGDGEPVCEYKSLEGKDMKDIIDDLTKDTQEAI